MTVYRYRLIPKSSIATPLRSDTLCGHLLCAARELDGDTVLGEILERFRADEPPFILSSAFPSGCFPMPILPSLTRNDTRELAEALPQFKGSLFHFLERLKKFRKQKWVPVASWQRLRTDLSFKTLFLDYSQDKAGFQNEQKVNDNKTEKVPEIHSSINRNTGRVLEGGLYTTETTFYRQRHYLDLYAETNEPDTMERYLSHVADTGFGKDRALGKGFFKWERDDTFAPGDLFGKGDHSMNLSVFSAKDLSSVSGTYEVFTKYGKVWNGFGENNPFKRPFLAFKEGSVFTSYPLRGSALTDVHSNPSIIHCTVPLMIRFKMTGAA